MKVGWDRELMEEEEETAAGDGDAGAAEGMGVAAGGCTNVASTRCEEPEPLPPDEGAVTKAPWVCNIQWVVTG